MTKNNQYRAVNGFWAFAFLPTELISGETVWLSWYWIAGRRHGGKNRYETGNSKHELKYSQESARLAGVKDSKVVTDNWFGETHDY